jgi:hypothetical protein
MSILLNTGSEEGQPQWAPWDTQVEAVYRIVYNVGDMLVARTWQETGASDDNRDPRFSTCQQSQNTTPRGISASYSDAVMEIGRCKGGSPLSTCFSTCRQRQNTTPRGIPASYSDAVTESVVLGRSHGRSHGNWRTQPRTAMEICTKFSDTRDPASERRTRRTREAVRLGRLMLTDIGRW